MAFLDAARTIRSCSTDADCVATTVAPGLGDDCTGALAVHGSSARAALDAASAGVEQSCILSSQSPCNPPEPIVGCVDGRCDLLPGPMGRCECAIPGAPGDACRDCACSAAACLTSQCACARQSPGCSDVMRCIQQTGCEDVGSCYRPDACLDAIDSAGGPFSAAVDAAVSFVDCLKAQCSASCASDVSFQ